jgi:hypothetical protein
VTECAQRIPGFPVLAHQLQAEVDRLCEAETRTRRYSNNSITLGFWLVVLKKKYKNDDVELVNLKKMLDLVHEQVLHRNWQPP